MKTSLAIIEVGLVVFICWALWPVTLTILAIVGFMSVMLVIDWLNEKAFGA